MKKKSFFLLLLSTTFTYNAFALKIDLEKIYLTLHQNPELSFAEKETAALLSTQLKQIGLTVTENFGGHGLVGVLKNGDGPVLMVRTDLDALPVKEETNLSYASKKMVLNPESGEKTYAMHACGHDIHMASFIGVANQMMESKDKWHGTLVMIGQPAEERGAGAKKMIQEGLFKRFPLPKAILGLHTHPYLKAGTVGFRQGAIMAALNSVNIRVRGIGGHGAMPHKTKDPVVLSSLIVTALQTISSREISPFEPKVITVGRISGGTKRNIIPDYVDLDLTVRSFSDEVQQDLLMAIKRIAEGQAASFGLPKELFPIVDILPEQVPTLINETKLSAEVKIGLTKALEAQNVIEVEPMTPSEDFSLFGRTEQKIPIHFFFLGVANLPGSKKMDSLPSLHSSKFAPDYKNAISTGVKAMTSTLIHLFDNPQKY